MGQSCLPVKLQPPKQKATKVRHHDPKDDMKEQEKVLKSRLEHNAAVDYAIKKNNQKENYFVIELLLSCKNLPDFKVTERASTFAVLLVDINSLDDHDKIVIGGVQEEHKDRYEDSDGDEESKIIETARTEDYVSEWTEKMITEVQSQDEHPIYFNSFTFSSSNMHNMKFKVQIF